MNEDLLTTQEACDRLRTSRQTLRRLVREGTLLPIKYGSRRHYWRSRDLDAFVARLATIGATKES